MIKTSHLIALTMTILVAGCAPESGEPIDLDAERIAILDADRAWSETPPDVGGICLGICLRRPLPSSGSTRSNQ